MTQGPDTPASYWEARYAENDRVWSGRVTAALTSIATDLQPGRSLDLGCGEGADVVWLAGRGWQATGIDISPTAVARAMRAADDARVEARFIARDLSTIDLDEDFDLVTASFLQSTVELDRASILRWARDRVAPGGHLIVVSHAEAPPWASDHAQHMDFPTPEDELDALSLDDSWQVVTASLVQRAAVGPDGLAAELVDSVVHVRRPEA